MKWLIKHEPFNKFITNELLSESMHFISTGALQLIKQTSSNQDYDNELSNVSDIVLNRSRLDTFENPLEQSEGNVEAINSNKDLSLFITTIKSLGEDLEARLTNILSSVQKQFIKNKASNKTDNSSIINNLKEIPSIIYAIRQEWENKISLFPQLTSHVNVNPLKLIVEQGRMISAIIKSGPQCLSSKALEINLSLSTCLVSLKKFLDKIIKEESYLRVKISNENNKNKNDSDKKPKKELNRQQSVPINLSAEKIKKIADNDLPLNNINNKIKNDIKNTGENKPKKSKNVTERNDIV